MSSRTLIRGLFTSRLALKNEDPAFLANALGLLSPKKSKTKSYKPSIFRHFQKGDVAENYTEIKRDLLPTMKMPALKDHTELVNNLLMDLQVKAVKKPQDISALSEANLLKHAYSLRSEDELVELACLLLQQNRLSLALLTRVLLNRHLINLQRLPFNIDNLDEALFCKNGWTSQNFMEYKVLLMKKYHDLSKPLDIIKILRSEFEQSLLPLIKLKSLSSFYERIVWKFYFEYAKQLHPEKDESFYVKALDNIDSTFTMWESSAENNKVIFDAALNVHSDLNAIQKAFIQLCICQPVQEVITRQLHSNRSRLLSELKKISISYKVARLNGADHPAIKAHAFSLINAVESLVKREFPAWAEDKTLNSIMESLVNEREHMFNTGVEVDSEIVFA